MKQAVIEIAMWVTIVAASAFITVLVWGF